MLGLTNTNFLNLKKMFSISLSLHLFAATDMEICLTLRHTYLHCIKLHAVVILGFDIVMYSSTLHELDRMILNNIM